MPEHDYRLLAEACRKVGRGIRLGPLESCLSGKIEDNLIVLRFRAVRIKETTKRWEVIAEGTRMVSYTWDGIVWKHQSFTVWDEDFTPYDIQLWGRRPLTRQERINQGRWEQDCFRPGNKRRPQDSFDREAQGYAEGGVTAWRN